MNRAHLGQASSIWKIGKEVEFSSWHHQEAPAEAFLLMWEGLNSWRFAPWVPQKSGEGSRLAKSCMRGCRSAAALESIITKTHYSIVYVQCVEGRKNPNQLVQTPCLRSVAVQNACSRFEAGDQKIPTKCRLSARNLLHSRKEVRPPLPHH
jgi:hypothetical protein